MTAAAATTEKPAAKEEPSGYESRTLVRVIQAARLAISDDKTRPGLLGLSYVEDKHRLIVDATNGHLCLRVEMHRSGEPLDKKRERRRIPASLIPLAIETLKVGPMVADIPEECTETEGDFPFPDIDPIFPKHSTDASAARVAGWHPDYVEMLGKIAKRLKVTGLRVQWPADNSSPLRADMMNPDTGVTAVFALMPMRI